MMKQWLKVHSRAYSKVNLLYGLLLGLNLLSLIICTIYYCINKYSFENFIEDDPDIDLTGLKSFSFTGKYDLYYKADLSNLGTTGKLYFDCYTGKCKYEKTYSCTKETCTINEDEKVECTSYESTCTDSYSQNEFSCSNVCRNSKKSYCGYKYCDSAKSSYHFDGSSCSHDGESESIDDSKSCNAENLILYWGNLYYQRQNNTKYKKYSYLNSAVPPNESCPTGKKMCGILDNLGNKLCYPKSLDCPLNYITTNKSELKYSTYGSTSLGTKTIYFSNQATKNGKIIGGLFVDSDLMIKYNDEDCEILEEGTVRKLLDSHPYKLYRKSLSYDPYKKVKNEKSYLKWCVPGVGKEKKISKIKELNIEYKYNFTTNKNIINPIKTSIGKAYFVSLPGYWIIPLFIYSYTFIF